MLRILPTIAKPRIILVLALFLSINASAQVKSPPTHSCHQVKNAVHGAPLTAKEQQEMKAGLERSDTFDIRHYDLSISVLKFDQQILEGTAIIDFRSKMDEQSHIRFDLEGLQVHSVTNNAGDSLSWTHEGPFLDVELDTSLQTDELYSVKVTYSGTPITCPSGFGGFYFEDQYAYNLGIGLQAKPHNFGRAWYPCFDNFVERATYTFRIQTHQGRKGYGVGTFMGEENTGGDTLIRTYEMMQPIPTYLSHIAASEYREVNYSHQGQYGNVPIQLVARRPDTANMRTSFQPLTDALDCLEDWYGPYQFERIGYTITTRGAMEHPTAVAYPASSIIDGSTNLGLITHELGHHWWGNVTTLKTEHDMWIKEGPASYAEHQIVEYLEGEKAFREAVRNNNNDMLRNAHVADGDFLALSPMEDAQIYGRHTYDKGAAMIHNLRGYLGDSLFRVGMQNVLSEKQFQSIDAQTFRDQLESATGQDLHPFFDHWIFQPGWSEFVIDSMEYEAGEMLLKIRQGLYGTDVLHQKVPLRIGFFHPEHGLWIDSILCSGEYTEKSFTPPFRPEFVFINPEQHLNLASSTHLQTIETAGNTTFGGTAWSIDVKEMPQDSLWFHLGHHLVPPSGRETVEEDFRISSKHYWSVHPSMPVNATARISYDGGSENGLDYDLSSQSEDSLIMLYRPTPQSRWMPYPHANVVPLIPGDGRGFINLETILPGDYALANDRRTDVAASNPQTPTSITISPNPTSGLLTFQSGGSERLQLKRVEVYNRNGILEGAFELNLNGGTPSVDLSAFPPGAYYLHWMAEDDQKGGQWIIVQ